MTDQIEKEITINELATIVINGFENVNKKFGNMDRQFENVDKRFGNMDRQFENVDKRFGNMDRQFENVNKKFGNMDRQFENVDKRFGSIDKQFENVDKRFGNMDRQFGNIDKEFKSVHQEIENLAISTANGFMEVHKEINGQNNEIKGIKSDLGDLKEYMNYRFTGVENRIDDLATTRVKREELDLLKGRVLVLEKR